MGDSQRSGPAERDIGQALTALKKGATLLKYGRRGKPKFCPFRLSNDESVLIWYSGREEKQLKLSQVSRIIPGQRTTIFKRYPRPEKEYQSFSLIYNDRSLDLICKDKDEAEVWFVGLKALISNSGTSGWRKLRNEARESSTSADGSITRRIHQPFTPLDAGNALCQVPLESPPQTGMGKAFSDIILYTASSTSFSQIEASSYTASLPPSVSIENFMGRSSSSDNIRISSDNVRISSDNLRISSSSMVSSSSQGSFLDDFDSLGDVFIWGEGVGEGIMGGGSLGVLRSGKFDANLPKALESTVVLDVHHIACGVSHAVLVNRQGEIFSWGEESGGRLGHGVEVDVSNPKLIDRFSGMNIELVACGEYHTCAITTSGDLFTWGGGSCNSSMLGHGSEAGHWVPKRVCGPLDGMPVSYVSCGPWHTAAVLSTGSLFTFGDGTFGVLGHGDRISYSVPREVEALKGQRTLRVACSAWHTAAIVDMLESEASFDRSFSATGKLFTWGEGDKGQLGHGDKEARLIPECVVVLMDISFSKVACGHDFTVALTTTGHVYTMGSTAYGQLGCPEADGRVPVCVEGKIADNYVEDIACGSHHVAVLTSKAEIFTWGKGTNGQLGHGDYEHRKVPTLVEFMKDNQVKSVACGSNFTAAICQHKWVSGTDHSTCTGCHNPFGFRRKRHNCYNCGQVFCKVCSSRKSLKASLAPNMNKPYRVCDDCYVKLKKATEPGNMRIPRPVSRIGPQKFNEGADKETLLPKYAGLSFVNSLKRTDSDRSKGGAKQGKAESSVLPIFSGFFQPGSIHQSSTSSPILGASDKRVSASAPGSRMASRAASPVSQGCSPVGSSTLITSISVPTSPEVMAPNSKDTIDYSRQEVVQLRAEVEKLTADNKLLEFELERTRKQLKVAKVIAVDETEKSKAAKEVIKSLTAQLKEMAEELQGRNSASSKLDSRAQSSGSFRKVSDESHLTSVLSPRSESNMTVDALLTNGTSAQSEKAECVVQDEPGVYITLCSLPGGGHELKRVRFSRKRFSEGQAEKWWAENSSRVCERHNIRNQ
ncbi:PH, RCC1 and FYVE domains-containing protein 1 [Beta vulgaris subsp. vulgaris]|uniref:PH, RCC1 and FYVE domains-containing protein 1 n=1 Tax=Beta vulgaris subsp. vulgaris TaxID=3555 RepID=UPI002037516B|nr:PH, RCC1 and FYVE domains-containing protein 1 [Beta vulgaris subsp. vulgaris]